MYPMTNIINTYYNLGQHRQSMQCTWERNAHTIITDKLEGPEHQTDLAYKHIKIYVKETGYEDVE